MQSPDQDFRCVVLVFQRVTTHMKADLASHRRYMSLNDLMTEIRTDAASFLGDETIENKVLNQVLQLVEDKISEVKNQAVKWCIYLPVI